MNPASDDNVTYTVTLYPEFFELGSAHALLRFDQEWADARKAAREHAMDLLAARAAERLRSA